jgi:hypothetical protein
LNMGASKRCGNACGGRASGSCEALRPGAILRGWWAMQGHLERVVSARGTGAAGPDW